MIKQKKKKLNVQKTFELLGQIFKFVKGFEKIKAIYELLPNSEYIEYSESGYDYNNKTNFWENQDEYKLD